MKELENALEYRFKDKALLLTAVTHSSYANENRKSGMEYNERLEFLGDSILGMTVADYLYKREPKLPEGTMTRLRAELVCERSLYSVAEQLNLGSYLRLGHGEEHTGGRARRSILADAVEALLAAVYLDSGLDEARKIIRRFIIDPYESGEFVNNRDYKTELQELVQKKSGQVLTYEMTGDSGPDHDKLFGAQVLLNGTPLGDGSGKNKKAAEQDAAKNALEVMQG